MAEYNDDNITTLEWDEHIRTRPGMYIGKLGDGSAHDDGIYVLFKEVIDNAIDEFMQGFGKTIEISIKENKVSIRDYGRGIPLTKVVDCVSKMNTGGKFKEGTAFDNSIGMNGVGVLIHLLFRTECPRRAKENRRVLLRQIGGRIPPATLRRAQRHPRLFHPRWQYFRKLSLVHRLCGKDDLELRLPQPRIVHRAQWQTFHLQKWTFRPD